MKKKNDRKRGSALVVSMLLLLVFLGLTVSITIDAQSQAALTGGIKLQQFYNASAVSCLNIARANLADHWLDPDAILSSDQKASWRFGGLLAQTGNVSADGYGVLVYEGSSISMNAGQLELKCVCWAANNPDDPSFMLEGVDIGDGVTPPIDPNFDMDGKIVLTAEIFNVADDSNDSVLATQSVLVGLTGAEVITRYEEGVREGDDSDPGNQGRGSLGRAGSLEIDSLKPATP